MTKAKRYDTVVLRESIGMFQQGEKGAVVEVYTMPYEAYDIEIITDEGKTIGLLEGVRPQQVERLPAPDEHVRFAAIRIEDDGERAAVHFSDGTQVIVQAEELHVWAR
jgi:hypothetical protein